MQTKRAHNVRPLPYQTEKHNYLNFAETKSEKLETQTLIASPLHQPAQPASRKRQQRKKQAVRSLVPLGCACYQASTCGLSTSSSGWDLDLSQEMGRLILGAASRLDAFSAYPFST